MNANANANDDDDGVQRSKPIPISTQHLRHRSTSFSSDSTSPASSPPVPTPINFSNTRIPVAPSSPILYFLSQSSPSKSPATFPFRGFVPPLGQDEQSDEQSPPAAHHARRASTAGRFQPPPPVPEPHHERGVNVLRRLSLSGSRPCAIPQPANPQSPPTSSPLRANVMQSNQKFRRSATVAEHARTHRHPSPMGERILKGHFDGFN